MNRLAAVMALAVLSLVSIARAQQPAETRVALVIGNSAYQHTDVPENPKNDARLMTDRLKAAGFKVTTLIDADQSTMKRAMVEFGRELRSSRRSGCFITRATVCK